MRTGEVVQIGQHRLMCGDAGNPEHVAALFDGIKPDLVFTSPPYLQQRAYDRAIDCWDTLMQRVFGAMPSHDTTQVLVNLGMVHRKGEWLPYWDGWIDWMRTQGWRRFGWYVWDKGEAMPGNWNGRLAYAHEYIFHFNKKAVQPNKTQPCKWAGDNAFRREKHGSVRFGKPSKSASGTRPIGSHKIRHSVIDATPQKVSLGHSAVFPVPLVLAVIESYSQPRGIIYDPFCGSGTSIIAAEQTGRIAYGMEISSEYCRIAVERIRKSMKKPKQGALAL